MVVEKEEVVVVREGYLDTLRVAALPWRSFFGNVGMLDTCCCGLVRKRRVGFYRLLLLLSIAEMEGFVRWAGGGGGALWVEDFLLR